MIVRHYAGYWGIQSTDTSKCYLIKWSNALARWMCECPDYQYRKAMNGQDCKHIKMLRAFIDKASLDDLRRLEVNGDFRI